MNDICPFIHITNILDKGAYPDSLKDFESSLKMFYACGAKTFLTKTTTGDTETFYMHALRFYMLPIAQQTFREHELGLGVFTMQGYERRNKESKNTLKRFNNNKGNLVVPNLRRLWDVFAHGKMHINTKCEVIQLTLSEKAHIFTLNDGITNSSHN